jgi:hypothetical protein
MPTIQGFARCFTEDETVGCWIGLIEVLFESLAARHGFPTDAADTFVVLAEIALRAYHHDG